MTLKPPDDPNILTSRGHVYDEGVLVTDRPDVDFVGDAVTVADDAVNNRTKVTVRGVPVVNVKDYGALPGLPDASAGLAAAAAALPNGVGVLLMPLGTYNTSSSLALGSKVTLWGMGQGTVIAHPASTPAITSTQTKKVTIRDLRIDMTGSTTTAAHGIYLNGSWNATVENVDVVGAAGTGLMVDTGPSPYTWGAYYNRIISCEFSSCGTGIEFTRLGGSIVCTTSSVGTCRIASNGVGIKLTHVASTTIYSSSAELSTSHGISCDNAAGCAIVGCDIEGNTGWGVQKTANTLRLQVLGGYIAGNTAGDVNLPTDLGSFDTSTTPNFSSIELIGATGTKPPIRFFETGVSESRLYQDAQVLHFYDQAGSADRATLGMGSGKLTVFGDIAVGTVGKGLQVAEGSNAKMGTATLVAGTVIVSTTAVATGDRIFLSPVNTGGTAGFLSYTISNGASFTVTSSSGTDTRTFNWMIVRPA